MLFQETIAKSYEDDQRRAYEAVKKTTTFTYSSPSTLNQSTTEPVESASNVFGTSNWINLADSNPDDLNDPNMPELEEIDDELNDEGIL
jgi:hypothetical protein